MSDQSVSIFNDVFGPVMRGPSSSHVAAAQRIGNLLLQASDYSLKRVDVYFDFNGSQIESHVGHGTNMGFACGIMNIPLTDDRVGNYWELLQNAGIELNFIIDEYAAKHPNYYKVRGFTADGAIVKLEAASLGGGSVVISSLDDFDVEIRGDAFHNCYVTEIIYSASLLSDSLEKQLECFDGLSISQTDSEYLISVMTTRMLTASEQSFLREKLAAVREYHFSPILPTPTFSYSSVPFRTASELLEYNKDKNLPLWKLALIYECARGNAGEAYVLSEMERVTGIMERSLQIGLAGTEYSDRILPAQSVGFDDKKIQERLIPDPILNRVIRNITAIMEAKSSMNVIVAAPTAGSCGCLPGTLFGLQEVLQKSREELNRAFLAAGMIGVFFSNAASFSAEIGGCQMECGAGSCMAAAGAVALMGGSPEECINAASMALQAITGLACDPIANRVEVPCLNKNVLAGTNAVSSANMILAGFDWVIPFDETLSAVLDIGKKLPRELKCTCGGLGKTETSLKLRQKLLAKKITEMKEKE